MFFCFLPKLRVPFIFAFEPPFFDHDICWLYEDSCSDDILIDSANLEYSVAGEEPKGHTVEEYEDGLD